MKIMGIAILTTLAGALGMGASLLVLGLLPSLIVAATH
jgi:hypothetical protein